MRSTVRGIHHTHSTFTFSHAHVHCLLFFFPSPLSVRPLSVLCPSPQIVNKTPFPIKVRTMIPCNRTNLGTAAVVAPGESYTATDDFEVLGTMKPPSHPKGILAIGDPFDVWIGDSTWMDITSEFHVSYDAVNAPSYLAYEQIGSSAAPTDGMHVSIRSEVPAGTRVYIKEAKAAGDEATGAGGVASGVATLCQLHTYNSSCLVRSNFVAEIFDASGGKVVASSDTFSAWWGGGSYATANVTLVVKHDPKAAAYLDMVKV